MATVMKPSEVEQLEKLATLHEQGALTEEEFAKAKTDVFEHTATEPAAVSTTTTLVTDKIGTGRYVLSFLLAGLIGLGVAYVLRNQGWLAIWINAAIFVAIVLVLLA